MKKFLKVFSLLGVVCCCLFCFVGCDVFKDSEDDTKLVTQVEYAELAKEREIVREVINNAYTMLNPNIEHDRAVLPTAEVNQDTFIDDDLQMYITFIKEVTSDNDFVPGKLYNAKIEEEEDGKVYGCYLLMNAYCDEDNMVTLNIWQAYNKDVSYYGDTVFVSYDLYFNEQYKVAKTVEYHHEYDNESGSIEESLGLHEFNYSLDGKITSGNGWSQHDTQKYSRIIRGNEYCSEEITIEQEELFDNAIKEVRERTYLYNFARPLSQEAQDRIFSDF